MSTQTCSEERFLHGSRTLGRVVLLGASNLTRGISTVVETARSICGSPLEVMAALGHGRSYGMSSRILARTLPGIVECGLWRALAESHHRPTWGLISDIGNDIMYGAEPAEIVGWVETSRDRLRDVDAETVMMLPPLAALRTMREWQYRIVKSILFPRRAITMTEAMERTEALTEGLTALAAARDIAIVAPPRDWYRFDPIHVTMRNWPMAWATVLSGWSDAQEQPVFAAGSLPRWMQLRLARPEHWQRFGRPCTVEQPACTLSDATTVALY